MRCDKNIITLSLIITAVVIIAIVAIDDGEKTDVVERFNPKFDDPICKNIYIDKKDVGKWAIIKNCASSDFCNRMIEDAEAYARRRGWSKTRHKNYPTTDNKVTAGWKIFPEIQSIIRNKIKPQIIRMHGVKSLKDIVINEIFIIKYDMGGQRSLDYHVDDSEFSFVLGLNNGFGGGGTTFKNSGKNIVLDVGQCLVFCGQNKHKGNEITSGTRYVLAGFLSYKKPNYCDGD